MTTADKIIIALLLALLAIDGTRFVLQLPGLTGQGCPPGGCPRA